MNTVSELLAATDRCVKCALCLPHCPTYQLHANENESPRGRIALAEGLLSGQLPIDSAVQHHLDRCVMCQRCESVCPTQVPYSRLMNGVRHYWPAKCHWTQKLLLRPYLLRYSVYLAQRFPRWQRWPLSLRLAQALGPQTTLPKAGVYPPIGRASRGWVGLLLGCATLAMQASALQAALTLLQFVGYSVVIPNDQGCCGALAKHQGDSTSVAQLTALNRSAFADVDTLLCVASGCSAGSSLELVDILTFLAEDEVFMALPWLAWSAAPVTVHLPCTLRNALAADAQVLHILRKVPGLKLSLLEGGCCGAAGNHLLHQRAQAVALRKPLLAQQQASEATLLLTTNVGCALHLAEGLHQLKQSVTVWHPVELLVRCLPEPIKQVDSSSKNFVLQLLDKFTATNKQATG